MLSKNNFLCFKKHNYCLIYISYNIENAVLSFVDKVTELINSINEPNIKHYEKTAFYTISLLHISSSRPIADKQNFI